MRVPKSSSFCVHRWRVVSIAWCRLWASAMAEQTFLNAGACKSSVSWEVIDAGQETSAVAFFEEENADRGL